MGGASSSSSPSASSGALGFREYTLTLHFDQPTSAPAIIFAGHVVEFAAFQGCCASSCGGSCAPHGPFYSDGSSIGIAYERTTGVWKNGGQALALTLRVVADSSSHIGNGGRASAVAAATASFDNIATRLAMSVAGKYSVKVRVRAPPSTAGNVTRGVGSKVGGGSGAMDTGPTQVAVFSADLSSAAANRGMGWTLIQDAPAPMGDITPLGPYVVPLAVVCGVMLVAGTALWARRVVKQRQAKLF
jgi:hypothetical protein